MIAHALPTVSGMLWAALATIYVVWGSTYLAIRVMVETMPPLLSAGVRFAWPAAIFWLILRLRRGRGGDARHACRGRLRRRWPASCSASAATAS